MTPQPTREAWLQAMVSYLRLPFDEAGYPIPDVRISCSWPSRSIRKAIGQCALPGASKDGRHQIAISPVLEDTDKIAATVVHELIHACLPDDVMHGKPFKAAMKKLGLEGKATATTAGEELTERLNTLCEKLGPYPHSALILDLQEKKQGTRMLKLSCPGCGYTVRTTAKWLEIGLPVCMCGRGFELEEKP